MCYLCVFSPIGQQGISGWEDGERGGLRKEQDQHQDKAALSGVTQPLPEIPRPHLCSGKNHRMSPGILLRTVLGSHTETIACKCDLVIVAVAGLGQRLIL